MIVTVTKNKTKGLVVAALGSGDTTYYLVKFCEYYGSVVFGLFDDVVMKPDSHAEPMLVFHSDDPEVIDFNVTYYDQLLISFQNGYRIEADTIAWQELHSLVYSACKILYCPRREFRDTSFKIFDYEDGWDAD